MRKYLAALFILSTFLLFNLRYKQERVAATNGNKIVFESGNYARVYDYGKDIGIDNPANHRTYEKFTFDNKLIEKGFYDNGEFRPCKNAPINASSLLFILSVSIIVLYLFFFSSNDFIYIRDLYLSKTVVPFTAMTTQQLKTALNGKMSCEKCNASPDFSVEKETRTHGMIFIEGKCNICSEKKSIRVK